MTKLKKSTVKTVLRALFFYESFNKTLSKTSIFAVSRETAIKELFKLDECFKDLAEWHYEHKKEIV